MGFAHLQDLSSVRVELNAAVEVNPSVKAGLGLWELCEVLE